MTNEPNVDDDFLDSFAVITSALTHFGDPDQASAVAYAADIARTLNGKNEQQLIFTVAGLGQVAASLFLTLSDHVGMSAEELLQQFALEIGTSVRERDED
jgi:ADP-ribosylglycohydrolase